MVCCTIWGGEWNLAPWHPECGNAWWRNQSDAWGHGCQSVRHILGQTHAPEMPLQWYNIGPSWLALCQGIRPVHIIYGLAENLHWIWWVNLTFSMIPLFNKHLVNIFRLLIATHLSKSPLDFPFHHHHTENDFHPNEDGRSINHNIGQPRYFRLSASHGHGRGAGPEIYFSPWDYISPFS